MIDEKKFLEEENNMIDARKIYKYIKAEINPYGKPFEGTVFEFGNKVMDYIKAMEKQPKTDWITCEVDIPKEEYGTYWIAVEVEQDKPYYYCSAVWTSKDGFRTNDIEAHGKIVAWKPIQLYKKEGAE